MVGKAEGGRRDEKERCEGGGGGRCKDLRKAEG